MLTRKSIRAGYRPQNMLTCLHLRPSCAKDIHSLTNIIENPIHASVWRSIGENCCSEKKEERGRDGLWTRAAPTRRLGDPRAASCSVKYVLLGTRCKNPVSPAVWRWGHRRWVTGNVCPRSCFQKASWPTSFKSQLPVTFSFNCPVTSVSNSKSVNEISILFGGCSIWRINGI